MECSNMWNIALFPGRSKIATVVFGWLVLASESVAVNAQSFEAPLTMLEGSGGPSLEGVSARSIVSGRPLAGAKWTFEAAATPSMFGIAELSLWRAHVGMNSTTTNLHFIWSRIGARGYSQQQFRTIWTERIQSDISVLASIRAALVDFAGYGAGWAANADVGTAVALSKDLVISTFVQNVMGAIGEAELAPPRRFSVSADWSAWTVAGLLMEMNKQAGFPLESKIAIRVVPVPGCVMQLGMTEQPRRLSGGLFVCFGGLRFGYAASAHSELGWTHHLVLGMTWGGDNDQ
jgi:hypothetical protein